jgi:uncharacterized protein YdeI (YjbR/CyaY-like superfamily)
MEQLLDFADASAWEAWLAEHHADTADAWLKIAKKGGGATSVTVTEALDVALCYGWIDGQTAAVDEIWYRQRFTPRRPRSRWSQINRASVERLHAEGRLAPAGIREMEAAQRDGRWEAAYPSPRNITVPPDLEAALEKDARARRAFEQLDRQNRFAILYRLHDAKKPETRERRLGEFVRMLARGEAPLARRSGKS